MNLITRNILERDTTEFFSVDLEHVGENCGILQLSVEAFDPSERQRLGEFCMYIKPRTGSTIPLASTNTHGSTMESPEIQQADDIERVWPEFRKFIENELDKGYKDGILVAWVGKNVTVIGCFRVTEELYGGTLRCRACTCSFLYSGRSSRVAPHRNSQHKLVPCVPTCRSKVLL